MATEFLSLLGLLTKQTRIFGNKTHTRTWWNEIMTTRPPPLSNRVEKHKGVIPEQVNQGCEAGE